MLAKLREYPISSVTMVVITLAGAAAGPYWTSPEWSLGRQLAAGAVAGFGVAFLIVLTHIIGAYDDFRD